MSEMDLLLLFILWNVKSYVGKTNYSRTLNVKSSWLIVFSNSEMDVTRSLD